MKNLPDIQKSNEGFKKIPIDKVGVRNIKIPLVLSRKDSNEPFHTIATVSSYCDLVEDVKGINMSRIGRTIFEELKENSEKIRRFEDLKNFVKKLKEAHNTDNIYIKIKFPFIYKNVTPITNIESYENVDVEFETTLIGDELRNYIKVKAIEMALCPCSKEMSSLMNNITHDELNEIIKLSRPLKDKISKAGFGAHNQKSEIEVKVETNGIVYIEDLIELIKKGASSPTWSILKRPDEKYVTEISYMGGYFDENKKYIKVPNSGPKFVEDISRDIAHLLNELLDNKIKDYIIIVNNQESIHSSDIMATSILSCGRNLR